MADARQQQPERPRPDPAAGHTPEERTQVEQASSFQGDKSKVPVDGEDVLAAGGTVPAVPPQTALPPEEQQRDKLPGPGR